MDVQLVGFLTLAVVVAALIVAAWAVLIGVGLLLCLRLAVGAGSRPGHGRR
jgi:uncharacterized membrane protein